MSRKGLIALSVLMDIGIADAVFKAYAIANFPSEQTAQLQSVLSFALHRNPGIAFDIPIPLSIVLPITLIICAGFSYLAYTKRLSNEPQALAALAAVIGALGNGIDRLINNFTTDYLILFRTSAINLSDVLILVGILGVLWYDRRTPQPQSTTLTTSER